MATDVVHWRRLRSEFGGTAETAVLEQAKDVCG